MRTPFQLYLDIELAQRVEVAVAEAKTTKTGFITQAIEEKLARDGAAVHQSVSQSVAPLREEEKEAPAVNIDPNAPPSEEEVWAALETTGRWDDGWIELPPNTPAEEYIRKVEQRQAKLGPGALHGEGKVRSDKLAQWISRLKFYAMRGEDPQPEDPEIKAARNAPYAIPRFPHARAVGGATEACE